MTATELRNQLGPLRAEKNRQDAWANAHRIPVEADKPEKERGSRIHPESFGQPAEKDVEWVRHQWCRRRGLNPHGASSSTGF
jgi:hypothetical protein